MSILSFPERGEGGDPRYRGNCSPKIIEFLIRQYLPENGLFLDICAGSGTSRDVAARMNVEGVFLDLNGRFGEPFDFTSDSALSWCLKRAGRPADVSFSHPPYGPMIRYSGSVWGNKADPRDTSQCDIEEFLEKSRVMLLNQRDATARGGFYTTLIGDLRSKGAYWSFQADFQAMLPREELKAVLIKAQHNCWSDKNDYRLKHPRILHEYLLVWQRSALRVFEIAWRKAEELRRGIHGTWRGVVRLALMKLGGEASLDLIYHEVEKCAPADRLARNANWKAKVRQTLQFHFEQVERGVWKLAA